MAQIEKNSSKVLRNQKFVIYLHRDIDVNRASPMEEGVDVFNVTIFMPNDEVGRLDLLIKTSLNQEKIT